jgi:uncharacterized membrane protein YvbJ
MTFCFKCGAENPKDSELCYNCNNPLHEIKYEKTVYKESSLETEEKENFKPNPYLMTVFLVLFFAILFYLFFM